MKKASSITDLEFGIEKREVGRFQPKQIAQLPVQAQNRFERDSIAELVEDIRGHSRIRRGYSSDTTTAAVGVHFSLYFSNGLVFLFFSCVNYPSLNVASSSSTRRRKRPIDEERFVNNNEQLTIPDSLLVTNVKRQESYTTG